MIWVDAQTVHDTLGYDTLIKGLAAAHMRGAPEIGRFKIDDRGGIGLPRSLLGLAAWQKTHRFGVKLISTCPDNSFCNGH